MVQRKTSNNISMWIIPAQHRFRRRVLHHHRIHRQVQHHQRIAMKMNLEVSDDSLFERLKRWSWMLNLDFLIGYGAFGVIWAVTDPRTSRRVALKKMPNVFQSVVAARRAFREIKMLCTFRHDNVNNVLYSRCIYLRLFRFYRLLISFNHLVRLNHSMKFIFSQN